MPVREIFWTTTLLQHTREGLEVDSILFFCRWRLSSWSVLFRAVGFWQLQPLSLNNKRKEIFFLALSFWFRLILCLIYCKYTSFIISEGKRKRKSVVAICDMARSQSLIILIFPGKPEVSILDDNSIVKLQHGKFYVGFSFVRSIKTDQLQVYTYQR